MKRTTRNNLIIIAVLVFGILGCCGSLIFAGRQQVGVGVSRSDCPAKNRIPPNATNINYTYIAWGPSMQLEYDLSEPDFLAWSRAEGWQLQQAHDKHVDRPGVFTNGGSAMILVKDAYIYNYTFPGGDGAGYSVTFDRANQRVYYRYSGH